MGGAGGDIWGGADAFHFRYASTPLSGDGSITAHVANEQNTNPFAKAGIMLRQSLTATSPHVMLDVKPDTSTELLTRTQDGGDTTYLGGTAPSGGSWLKLSRTGSQVTAAVSTDGSSWTVVGTATLSGPVYLGLAVTSHDEAALNQARFDGVTVSAQSSGTLPAPWTLADIGNVGQAGSAAASGSAFTITAAGADIWGAADSFTYMYQSFSGDGFITASIDSLQDTSPYAKAGVMMRASTQPGAANVILDVKPDGGIELMVRDADGAQTRFIAGTASILPVELRLTRQGSTVLASVSGPAVSWFQSVELTLPDSAFSASRSPATIRRR